MGRGRWLPWTRRCTRRRLPRSTLRSEACSAAWTCLAPPSRTKWTRRVLHPVLIGHAVFGCVDVPAPPRPHPLLAAWCAVSLRGRCVWAPETETSSQGRGQVDRVPLTNPLPLLLRCAGTGGTRQHASCLPLHCPPGSPPQKQNCPATAHASAPGHWRCLSRHSARPVRSGPQPPRVSTVGRRVGATVGGGEAERAAWLLQPLATLARLSARRPALERAGLCPVSPQALASAAEAS